MLKDENLTIIADYAHHPTEIDALLKMARCENKGAEILVVFQPHRYTRTQSFASEFSSVLKQAGKVFLLPVYAASEPEIIQGKTEAINQVGEQQWEIYQPSELPNKLSQELVPHKKQVVLFVGAGDIDKLAEDFAHKYNLGTPETIAVK